jgi:hypothetical protein
MEGPVILELKLPPPEVAVCRAIRRGGEVNRKRRAAERKTRRIHGMRAVKEGIFSLYVFAFSFFVFC